MLAVPFEKASEGKPEVSLRKDLCLEPGMHLGVACADQGQRPGDKPAQGNALGNAWSKTKP